MKPIVFNTPMVRAILEGRKTVARRMITSVAPDIVGIAWREGRWWGHTRERVARYYKPKYKIGDLLWVRETWAHGIQMHGGICYRADGKDFRCEGEPWQQPLRMPKEIARIFLRVTNVYPERLQDITEQDALREGMYRFSDSTWLAGDFVNGLRIDEKRFNRYLSARSAFQAFWDSLSEKRGYAWSKNPWVWVYEFEVISDCVEGLS